MERWFYSVELEPRLKPRECVQVDGRFLEVVEVRPALPFDLKLVGISSTVDVDLKERGLRALKDELLDLRLRVSGPVRCTLRVEGAAGPVFGGWGAVERLADEGVSPNLLEVLVFGEERGWLHVRVEPVAVPAWARLRAEGFAYVVREVPRPAAWATPAYVWRSRAGGGT